MGEISISSLVGELPLNNVLKDPSQNKSCSLSPNLCKTGRRIQSRKEEGRGGMSHGVKDDTIRVICEISQALI